MSRKVVVLVAVVVVLAVTAGCMGLGNDSGEADRYGGNGNGDSAAGNGNGGAGDETTYADADADARQAVASTQETDRQLIRTAELSVSVDSYETARTQLTAEAEGSGGYLSESDQRTREREFDNRTETWTEGTLTYRVPSESFDSFYAAVEGTGNVTDASTGTEDVSDQLVDLEARIDNLETQRDRLRGLYEDANETQDVLSVEQRLSEVQAEIERLEAQRESLRDRVAYSTVTVTLSEPAPEPETAATKEAGSAWYETSVVSAFVSSIGGVATVARAAVVAGAYLAPYALAFGTPLALVLVGKRRYLNRGHSSASTETTERTTLDADESEASDEHDE
ncbi:DUF4349 domain-containing protein [Halobacteria archaeon AArc-m2/3/4]|uniref:DUF4349 domain-containing protein n=1 Tax=Natronoglomus mannanivorans TaxID=2979990 RepID=A0ABT2QAJ9_9EURY|nr:DUF4349 domain-containing protein [Halobacteria archaeon AArc-m2/3/4]